MRRREFEMSRLGRFAYWLCYESSPLALGVVAVVTICVSLLIAGLLVSLL